MKIRKIAQTPGLLATVVNNLNSDSTTDALSAKQGKELKRLIDELPTSGGSGGETIIIDAFPIGAVVSYSSDTIPSDWLLCDGSAVSRTGYADLFSIIGTTYGNGDGTTTFNLPNYMTRVPVGKWASDSDFANLGQMGGEKRHQLTLSEMPIHSHDIGAKNNPEWKVGDTTGIGGTWEHAHVLNTQASFSQPHNSTLYEAMANGGNQSHNNLQPYIVTNYIIKAKQKTNSGGATGTGAPEIAIGAEVPTGEEVLWINEEDEIEPEDIDLKQIVTTGVESVTNEWIDGKQVYRKRINVGALPNAGEKTVDLGFNVNTVNIIRMQGMAYAASANHYMTLPYTYPSELVSLGCYHKVLSINCQHDGSPYNAYVDIYYTKK